MTSTVILFLICQISSMILNETKNSQIKAIEANSKTMSPTEKMKCEQNNFPSQKPFFLLPSNSLQE